MHGLNANPSDSGLIGQLEELARRVRRGMDIPPRLLDITDAARYLGTSDKAVRKLIAGGELPYIQRIAGRSPYLLDINDLDDWIDRNKTRIS